MNILSSTLVASSFPAPNVVQLNNSHIKISVDLPFTTTISPQFTISLVLPDSNTLHTYSKDKGKSHYVFNVSLPQVGTYTVTVTYNIQFGNYTTDTSLSNIIEGKCNYCISTGIQYLVVLELLYIIIHVAYEQRLLFSGDIIFTFIVHVTTPFSTSILATSTIPISSSSSPATITTTTTPSVSSSLQYIIVISGLLVFIVLVIMVTMVIIGLLCRKLRALKNKLSLYSENSVVLAVISANEL